MMLIMICDDKVGYPYSKKYTTLKLFSSNIYQHCKKKFFKKAYGSFMEYTAQRTAIKFYRNCAFFNLYFYGFRRASIET